MPKSVKMKYGNERLQNGNVQKLWKTTPNLDRIANEGGCEKTKETTNVTTKKLELKSSPEKLEILKELKEGIGNVIIEYRANNSVQPIAETNVVEMHLNQAVQEEFAEIKVEDQIEFGAPSISVQSIHITGSEAHNYHINSDGFTAIKVEDDVDIKIEDEMEFCAISTSIAGTGNEEHNYQPVNAITELEDEMDIKEEGEIEYGEPMLYDQSISTFDDEPHSTKFEYERDAYNASETTIAGQPDEGNKRRSEFTCDICSKQCTSKGNLKAHRIRHDKPNFHCTICGVGKFHKNNMDAHMRTHDSNRIYYTCEICSKKFVSMDNWTKHRLRHGEPNFKCTICGVAKFHKSELDSHMRTHDTNRKLFTCEICSKECLSKSNLSKHLKLHDKPNFHCTVCGVAKFYKNNLDLHMRTHEKNRKYVECDICMKKVLDSHLYKHRKLHGDSDCGASLEMPDTNSIYFTCDICSKKYSTMESLRRHHKRHVKPTFHCTICGVAKFHQYELDAHMTTHDTNQTYFTCDLCRHMCTTRENLTRHRLRHGKPKFHCTICGVSKFTKREFNGHIRTHDTKTV